MRTAKLSAVLWLTVATAQEPTCRLEGRVLDALQEPVANAELTAVLDGDVVARTRTDASGVFVFGRLPQRVLTVTARSESPAVGAAWLDLLGLERQFATMTLMPARPVRGIAVDENGRRLGGAWVVAVPGYLKWPGMASLVQADADGHFVLTHVPCGPSIVRVWAPGHECFEGEVGGGDAEELHCVLRAGARRERAFELVGADAAALATAQLHASATHRGLPLPLPPPLRRPALEQGTWRLCGWPIEDEIQARVVLSAGDTDPPVVVVPGDRSGGIRRFAFVDEPRLVRGSLPSVDVSAGTWLVAEPVDGPGQRTFGIVARDGTFAFAQPVPPGHRFSLRVLHPDWVFARENAQAATWWIATHDVGLRHEPPLRRATRVRLRTVRADGAPASGTEIRIVAPGAWQVGADVPPPAIPVATFATGCTALDGCFEIGNLDLAADHEFVCLAEGADGWTMRPFRSRGEGLHDLGDLPLTAGCTVEIRCVGSRPSDSIGADVMMTRVACAPGKTWTAFLDRGGRARIRGLFPGLYHVSTHGDGRFVTVAIEDVATIEMRR